MRMYKHLKLKPGKRSRSSFKNATKKAEKKKEWVKYLKKKISRMEKQKKGESFEKQNLSNHTLETKKRRKSKKKKSNGSTTANGNNSNPDNVNNNNSMTVNNNSKTANNSTRRANNSTRRAMNKLNTSNNSTRRELVEKDVRPCRERFSIKPPRDYVRIITGKNVGKEGMIISSATSWERVKNSNPPKMNRRCKYYIQYPGEEEQKLDHIMLHQEPELGEYLKKIGSEPLEPEETSKTNNIELKKIDKKELKKLTRPQLLKELEKSLKYITDKVYDEENPVEGSYESIVKANTRGISRLLIRDYGKEKERCVLNDKYFEDIVEAYNSTCRGKKNEKLKNALLRNMGLFMAPDKNLHCTKESGEEFKKQQKESYCRKT